MQLLDLAKVKIVEILCPFTQFEKPELMSIFSKVLAMRKQGYSSRHQMNALPVDTYDFIGNHYLITAPSENGTRVLGGYRTVSLNGAKHFNLTFPLKNLLVSANATTHLKALDDRLGARGNEQREFTYVSSWTNDPALREDRNVSRFLLDLVTTMNVYSQAENPNQYRFACGVPRLKTEKYIQWLGYKPIQDGQESLPEVNQANLCGEPVLVHELPEGHSKEAFEIAAKYRTYWENRSQLGVEDRHAEKAVA